MKTVAGQFRIGSALYDGTPKPPIPQPTPSQPFPPPPWPGPRFCVECGRAALIFDVDAGPWCGILCRVLGSCIHCGLPPSDVEGHWCRTDLGETWRRWSAS